MSHITLTAKPVSRQIDCRALSPQALQGKTAAEISAIKLTKTLAVAEVFEVAVDGSDAATKVTFKNTNAQHAYMGFGMTAGQVIVEGDAGDFLGAQMQNGVLICKGNAGARAGDRMRRGMLLIEGNAGDYCASDMMAGTLGVLGNTGAQLGYGMKRGTLLLAKAPALQATWIDCGMHKLPFLNILYKSFKLLDSRFAGISSLRVRRWMGDMGGLGKAEILLIQ
ncbi:formylmethanofuran dehydrogenase, subunit C /formyltransferase/hydrolase complex subunit C [Methylophilus rhizosphaerae]|uniref:Formylmethanofuran dehydrogenase, subunit C /formyltransferase/hydrolase complex subunit C n=1 Tax=Methylophilus rhizosphaerae TaxID=492660 RepID=A0A1G9B188_9PROT|nr:formylmethanofuran dehydrogenase subunit C [Methylophilus rhizosphaerae]SDK33302.1 formylmethanofuran dehydrogenase, subunit C /formyltransferase/hydrolase complex subunit C [Methylophilus rhizosphaerae]